jgi:hypothetical protein
MAFLVAVAVFLSTRSPLVMGLQVLLIALFSLRLAVSLMRSYLGALVLAGAVFWIRIYKMPQRSVRHRMVSLAIVLCMIVGLSFLLFPGRVGSIQKRYVDRFETLISFHEAGNISALSRLSEAKAVCDYSLRQPLVGHGFGFKYQYYRPNGVLYHVSYAHCLPLYFFLTLGLVGVCTVGWLVIRVLRLSKRVIKGEDSTYWKGLAIALYANFVAMFVLSFVVTTPIGQSSFFYLTIAMGIIAAMEKLQTQSALDD